MWLIWILVGIIIGFITGFLVNRVDKKSDYIRRGIINREYTVSGSGDCFEAQFEIGETERTDSKSKIKILNCTVISGTKHNDVATITKVKKLIDDTWIESNSIEWIVDSIVDERNKKLEKILN